MRTLPQLHLLSQRNGGRETEQSIRHFWITFIPQRCCLLSDLSEETLGIIDKIVVGAGVPRERVVEDLRRKIEQVKTAFPELEGSALEAYSATLLWARYIEQVRTSIEEVEVIPLGYDYRTNKVGEKTSHLYMMTNGQGGLEKHFIRFRSEDVDIVKTAIVGMRYKVRIFKLPNSGNYGGDSRTKFENPIQLRVSTPEMMKKLAKEVPSLREARSHLSVTVKGRGQKEFTDSLDWRIVRGVIVRLKDGQREDGSSYGVYNLVDTSLPSKEEADAEGNVIQPSFAVWIDPSLMTWDRDSDVYAVGTIQLDKRGQTVMQAINVVPASPACNPRR